MHNHLHRLSERTVKTDAIVGTLDIEKTRELGRNDLTHRKMSNKLLWILLVMA